MQGLERILRKLRKLISRILYNLYQREREDWVIDDEEKLGNGAEPIREYREDDPNYDDGEGV